MINRINHEKVRSYLIPKRKCVEVSSDRSPTPRRCELPHTTPELPIELQRKLKVGFPNYSTIRISDAPFRYSTHYQPTEDSHYVKKKEKKKKTKKRDAWGMLYTIVSIAYECGFRHQYQLPIIVPKSFPILPLD